MSTLQRQLKINSDVKNLKLVREFVAQAVTDSDLNESDKNRVTLAVDESVSNVVRHAYNHNSEKSIEVCVSADEYKFQVVITDSGRQFQPDNIKDPKMEEHVKAGKKNGLGLFIVRKVMDEVTYKSGHQNELTLVKYIQQPREIKGA